MMLDVEDYLVMEDDLSGYCTNCKDIVNHGSVEPDARNYECEVCGKNTVQGSMSIIGL